MSLKIKQYKDRKHGSSVPPLQVLFRFPRSSHFLVGTSVFMERGSCREMPWFPHRTPAGTVLETPALSMHHWGGCVKVWTHSSWTMDFPEATSPIRHSQATPPCYISSHNTLSFTHPPQKSRRLSSGKKESEGLWTLKCWVQQKAEVRLGLKTRVFCECLHAELCHPQALSLTCYQNYQS